MKQLILTIMASIALFIAVPAAHAADDAKWFALSSTNGETTSINTDIKAADNGQAYLVWVRYSYDEPAARDYYTKLNEFSQTIYYKVILYKFTEDWNKFNIVQAAYYGAGGKVIYEYTNPDMPSTESVVPAGAPIDNICNAAQVIYKDRNNLD